MAGRVVRIGVRLLPGLAAPLVVAVPGGLTISSRRPATRHRIPDEFLSIPTDSASTGGRAVFAYPGTVPPGKRGTG